MDESDTSSNDEPQSYLHHYPHVCAASEVVSDLLSVIPSNNKSNQLPNGSFELESRLGHKTKQGTFESGITSHQMRVIKALLLEFNGWHKVTPWTEQRDFFYAIDKPTNPLIRSTLDTSTNLVTHIKKHRCNTVEFSTGVPDTPDVRVALNFEEKIVNIPGHVNPVFVRIKRRQQFQLLQGDTFWKYDLTESWHGQNQAEAEIQRRENNTTYEVEVECGDPLFYAQQRGFTEDKAMHTISALSLLLKTCDLLSLSPSTYKLSLIQ